MLAGSSGARPAQKQSSTSTPSGQSGKKRKSRKGKAPFSSSSGGSGRSGGKGEGTGKKSTRQDVSPNKSRGLPGSALEVVAGDRSGVLGRDRSPGRLLCSLHGLLSSPFSHPGIVSDVPGRLSSGSSLAARGRGDACQRSLRNRPRSGSWLLQSSFPGGEGVWRPVISLSHLNEFIHHTRFKMETVASVLLSVREGDFLASLDLKDAYFQIPIHRSSRKLLRFTLEGTVYQFRALCFGLSTAPQVFTRVFTAVSAWAHSPGIRLLRYLDDWLILASSERETKQSVQSLLSLCHTLGIVINEKNSDLVPSQTAKYRWHDHRYRGRQVFSVAGASREIPDGSGELLYHGRSPGSALAGDPLSPGFARAAGSSRLPSDALSAVASQGALVPRVRPSLSSGAFALGSETGSVLVDGEGSSFDGGSIRDTCSGFSPVFGRVLFWVGRSPPRSARVRGVVGPGKVVAHQSSRDEGSVLGPSGFSRRCHRSSHDSDVM